MVRVKVKAKNYELIAKVRVPFGTVVDTKPYDVLEKNVRMGFFKLQNVKRNKLEMVGPIGISLHERMKRPISQYDFFYIMEGFVDLIQKIEKYESDGLSCENLVLDLKHVFFNETTKELALIYLPMASPHGEADIMSFINQIIYSAKPAEGSDYISSFNYFLKNLGGFDAKRIEGYICRVDRGIVNCVKKIEDDELTDVSDDELTDVSDDESTDVFDDELTDIPDEEATALLEEDKTDLNEDVRSLPCPTLERIATGEVIRINKSVFRLGKEMGCVDYLVRDNAMISRSHADIISREGRYFVLDLRSKNKTYINNRVLPVEQEVEIFDGDILKLANEEFLFQM